MLRLYPFVLTAVAALALPAASQGNEAPAADQDRALAASLHYACDGTPANFNFKAITDAYDNVGALNRETKYVKCTPGINNQIHKCPDYIDHLAWTIRAMGGGADKKLTLTFADMFVAVDGVAIPASRVFYEWHDRMPSTPDAAKDIKDKLKEIYDVLVGDNITFRELVKRRLNYEYKHQLMNTLLNELLDLGFQFPLFDCDTAKYGSAKSRLESIIGFVQPHHKQKEGAFGNTPWDQLYRMPHDDDELTTLQIELYINGSNGALAKGLIPQPRYKTLGREAPACCCKDQLNHAGNYNKCSTPSALNCNTCVNNCCIMGSQNCPTGHGAHS